MKRQLEMFMDKEAAQRTPTGRPYPKGQSPAVEYKTPPHAPLEEEEQVYSILNEKGQEIPDSVPLEPPLGYSAGPSLADFVQRMIHTQLSAAAHEAEMETFEEAEDFDIEDDPVDPLTPYEAVFYGPKPGVAAGQSPAAVSAPEAAAKPLPEGVAGEVVQPAPAITPNEKA